MRIKRVGTEPALTEGRGFEARLDSLRATGRVPSEVLFGECQFRVRWVGDVQKGPVASTVHCLSNLK